MQFCSSRRRGRNFCANSVQPNLVIAGAVVLAIAVVAVVALGAIAVIIEAAIYVAVNAELQSGRALSLLLSPDWSTLPWNMP